MVVSPQYAGEFFLPQAFGFVKFNVQGFKGDLVHYFSLAVCLRMLDRGY